MTINKETQKTLDMLDDIIGEPLTLGGLIRTIRECEEQTQVKFAQKLKVSRQKLCDIEHGRCLLSPKMAASFAIKLGYSQNQFVRLALQDILDRDGIHLTVEIQDAA